MLAVTKNDKGSTLLIAVQVIAAVSIVVAMAIFYRSSSLAQAGHNYRDQAAGEEATHELAVIFANTTLCKNLVKINGTTFTVNGGFQTVGADGGAVLSADKNISITKMNLENVADVGAGYKQGDFVIYTRNTNVKKGNFEHRSRFPAVYKADGSGNITDCRIVITAQQACADLGMAYSGGRCLLCEKLGGSWSGGACDLPE